MSDNRTIPTGLIEVDLFPEEIDDPDHPQALRFRQILEEVADDYGCSLVSFEVSRGTVSFAFDDDVLTAEIIREMEIDYGD